jgi:glycosyltransferase involved in cell wall biosynthesis
MKLLFLTRYDNFGASSRMRSIQYFDILRNNGYEVTLSPLLNYHYLNSLYSKKTPSYTLIFYSYLKRVLVLFKVKKFDLIIVEKEIFPWLPSWAEQLLSTFSIKYIVDFDDAIFHNYDLNNNYIVKKLLFNKIKTVIANSSCVIVGNEYLYNYAIESQAKKIHIIPTVIDFNKYKNISKKSNKIFTIGWIGSPSTVKYLDIVKPVLIKLLNFINFELVVIGATPNDFLNLPVKVLKWTEDSEVININQFDVGIMPLPDEPWEQGKCGYKLIQYLACGVPVICSPIGVNKEIVETGKNGFLANNEAEWLTAFLSLHDSPLLCNEYGNYGRNKVINQYSLQSSEKRFIEIVNNVCKS